jgi:hypothetical protein
LDAGRGQRTATRQQRRALRAIYRTCAIERCTAGYEQCELHHIVPWWQHGNTDVANLVPLCNQHHHMVHEGHHRITINPSNRALTIHHPDGRVTIQAPPEGLSPPASPAGPKHPPTGHPDSDPAAAPAATEDRPTVDPATGSADDGDRRGATGETAGGQPPPRPRHPRPVPAGQPGDPGPPTLFGERPPPKHRARAPVGAA